MLAKIKVILITTVLITQSSNSFDLNCHFVYYTDGYNCRIEGLHIQSPNTEITNITGNHTSGKENVNVDVLYIPDTNWIKFLPVNIHKYFANLKKIEINENGLKSISKSVFSHLISLVNVDI